MRFEMTPIGTEHGNQQVIPLNVANLYAGFQSLPIRRYINSKRPFKSITLDEFQ
jgi:hypothetical protein